MNLCLVMPSNRTRGNGQSLNRKFHLNLRKNFFPLQVTGCPERMRSVPCWNYSRAPWTPPCAMCSGMTLLEQGSGTR